MNGDWIITNSIVGCDKKGGFIMQDLIEIRWHGRGGQGAKTAYIMKNRKGEIKW